MPTSTETIELSIVMPCLNEAETLAACIDKAQGYLARSGVTARSSSPTTAAPTARRTSPARTAPAWSTCRAKGYGSALHGRHRGRARRATSSWATPTTATTSPTSTPFVERLRDGLRARHGQPLQGRHRAGRHAAAAQVPRQPGPVVDRPAVLPLADRRLPLRPARLQPPGRSCDLHLQTTGMEFASEMVVKSHARRAAGHRGADDARQGRPQPTAAPAQLARRLAAPALPADLQPALAVPDPGRGRVLRSGSSATLFLQLRPDRSSATSASTSRASCTSPRSPSSDISRCCSRSSRRSMPSTRDSGYRGRATSIGSSGASASRAVRSSGSPSSSSASPSRSGSSSTWAGERLRRARPVGHRAHGRARGPADDARRPDDHGRHVPRRAQRGPQTGPLMPTTAARGSPSLSAPTTARASWASSSDSILRADASRSTRSSLSDDASRDGTVELARAIARAPGRRMPRRPSSWCCATPSHSA